MCFRATQIRLFLPKSSPLPSKYHTVFDTFLSNQPLHAEIIPHKQDIERLSSNGISVSIVQTKISNGDCSTLPVFGLMQSFRCQRISGRMILLNKFTKIKSAQPFYTQRPTLTETQTLLPIIDFIVSLTLFGTRSFLHLALYLDFCIIFHKLINIHMCIYALCNFVENLDQIQFSSSVTHSKSN